MDDKKKFFINNLFVFSNRIFSKVITLFIFLFIARTYSIAEFGVLILITTLTNIFAFVLDFGSSNLLVREIAINNQKQSRLLINILVVKISFLGIIIALFFLVLKLLGESLNFQTFIIFSFGIFFESVVMSSVKSFEGLEKMNISSFLVVIERIFIGISLITLEYDNLLDGYAISYLFSNFFTFCIAIVFFIKNKGFKNSIVSLHEIRYILNKSLVFFLFGILSIIYNRTDTFILQYLNGNEQLGLYRANQQLIESIYFIPMSLGVSILPMFSRFFHSSIEKFKNFFKLMFSGLFLLGSFISLFVIFNAEIIIKILYGDKFITGSYILQILSVTFPIFFLNSLIGNTLISIKKEKIQFLSMLFGTIIKIIFLYGLTIVFGVLGTSISIVIGELVILLIQSSGVKNLEVINFNENRIYVFYIVILLVIHLVFSINTYFSMTIIIFTFIFLSIRLLKVYKILT